jgi:hypothetical protein
VDLAVLIEPAWDDIRLPRNVTRCLWYQRSEFSMVRQAKVNGASPTTIKGGHDNIPHSAELIADVVKAINEISETPERKKPGPNRGADKAKVASVR